MDTEDKIRGLMRNLDIRCPSCGSDAIGIEKEKDTDLGISDTILCADCSYIGKMISSVTTQFIQTNDI